MNFDFSPEQKSFRDQVRKLAERSCPMSVVRDVLEGRTRFPRDFWQALSDLGLPAIGIPESLGGIGMGVEELCVAAEELGRALAPVPFLSSRALAAEALLRTAQVATAQSWLWRLADGAKLGCYASPRTSILELDVDGNRISGEIRPVVGASDADLLVIAFEQATETRLLAVELRRAEVSILPVETIDPTVPQAAVSFRPAVATSLATGAAAKDAVIETERLGALVAAFEQLGGAERCLQMARDHALERQAFGRPIGSFQAIKHKLVDVYVRNTLARAHAYHGAWALATAAPDRELAVASARTSCTDAFAFAAQENLHIHGGMGFTWASDCHLFYRRARHLALCLGNIHAWKDRIASALELASAA